MSKARIQILGWRQHGDDDDTTTVAVYGADDPTDALDQVREDYDIPETQEEIGEYEGLIYTNHDGTIHDGDVMEWRGRKFKVSIQEVTNG